MTRRRRKTNAPLKIRLHGHQYGPEMVPARAEEQEGMAGVGGGGRNNFSSAWPSAMSFIM